LRYPGDLNAIRRPTPERNTFPGVPTAAGMKAPNK
jgi:hypothetical protein